LTRLDAMPALYTLSVFIHVLAACAWIGAMIFFAVAVVPVVRRPQFRNVFAEIVRGVGARFRVLGWTCVIVLVATGIANCALRGLLPQLTMAAFWSTDFGRLLAYKLALVLLVVIATAAHDLLFGASAMRLLEKDPSSPASRRSRRMASWLGRSSLLLSLAVLLFAVWLVRGMP
jgi:putative copper export protein